MNSMTGFGRATLGLTNHLVTLEVFSVNKKGLEIVFSAPKEWQAFERQANSFLRQSVERGRIRISISVEQSLIDENAQGLFDKDLMESDLNESSNDWLDLHIRRIFHVCFSHLSSSSWSSSSSTLTSNPPDGVSE